MAIAFLNSADRNRAAINRAGFYRLIWLGMLDVLVTFPLALSQIVNSALDQPMAFWPGWHAIHKVWTPLPVPKSTWDASFGGRFNVHLPQFFSPFVALVFFSIFGFSREATWKYRWVWGKVRSLVRRNSKATGSSPKVDVEIAFKEGESTSTLTFSPKGDVEIAFNEGKSTSASTMTFSPSQNEEIAFKEGDSTVTFDPNMTMIE